MGPRFTGLTYLVIILAVFSELFIDVYAREKKRRRKGEIIIPELNPCNEPDGIYKFNCQCENTIALRNATKAECWVHEANISQDDVIWTSFSKHKTLETLSFNVLVDGGLDFVPNKALEYLPDLRYINIEGASITDIESYTFSNFTNLRDVTIACSQIHTLQEYAFAYLPNIKKINLEDNFIKEIGLLIFFEVPKLQTLTIAKNNITTVKDGSFKHTYNLHELDLNTNNISNLNRNTFDGLANLKKLDLRVNNITNVTNFAFSELWNVEEIHLSKNKIKIVSVRAFDGLGELKKLFLDNNKLSELPETLFEGMRGVSNLDLRNNELHVLTLNAVKPIMDNLKSQNSSLLIEGNNFVCNCHLNWMRVLWNITESETTKKSLEATTCTFDSSMEPPDDKFDFKDDAIYLTKFNTNTNKSTNKNESIREHGVREKGIKKYYVLKLNPTSLPCPGIVTTTEIPSSVVYPVNPVQKEMKTSKHPSNFTKKLSLNNIILMWSCFVFTYILKSIY